MNGNGVEKLLETWKQSRTDLEDDLYSWLLVGFVLFLGAFVCAQDICHPLGARKRIMVQSSFPTHRPLGFIVPLAPGCSRSGELTLA